MALYLLGFRGLQLFGAALVGGFVLTVVLAGPFDRVIPPRLEPYEAPFWKQGKQDKNLRLFPDERTDSEEDKQTDGSDPE